NSYCTPSSSISSAVLRRCSSLMVAPSFCSFSLSAVACSAMERTRVSSAEVSLRTFWSSWRATSELNSAEVMSSTAMFSEFCACAAALPRPSSNTVARKATDFRAWLNTGLRLLTNRLHWQFSTGLRQGVAGMASEGIADVELEYFGLVYDTGVECFGKAEAHDAEGAGHPAD